MLRKMICLHLFAAAICIAANGLVSAECGTCGGGCGPVAGCPGGNCLGSLLGNLNHGNCGHDIGGPCMTCNNLWDDYCATKQRCLPQAKYPFQNRGCGQCGACSTCNAGVGVGLYGKCAPCSRGAAPCAAAPCTAAPCEPAACDAPCAASKYSAGGLLNKLFHHKGPKLGGCTDPGCTDCASSGSMYSQSAPESSASPASDLVPPAPADAPSAEMTPAPPVPPAPAIAPSPTDQTSRGSGAFDWLQQALQTK